MIIENAQKWQSESIARLIMEAMDLDCCQYFAGPEHTLDDFRALLCELIEMEDAQYSYRNTLVALADGDVAGICVCYNGGELHRLHEAFFSACERRLGMNHRGMDDETGPGELYVDSLAVAHGHRRQGIATALLHQARLKAKALGLKQVGVLVDQGNWSAQTFYEKIGFRMVAHAAWGGHPMLHLQWPTNT